MAVQLTPNNNNNFRTNFQQKINQWKSSDTLLDSIQKITSKDEHEKAVNQFHCQLVDFIDVLNETPIFTQLISEDEIEENCKDEANKKILARKNFLVSLGKQLSKKIVLSPKYELNPELILNCFIAHEIKLLECESIISKTKELSDWIALFDVDKRIKELDYYLTLTKKRLNKDEEISLRKLIREKKSWFDKEGSILLPIKQLNNIRNLLTQYTTELPQEYRIITKRNSIGLRESALLDQIQKTITLINPAVNKLEGLKQLSLQNTVKCLIEKQSELLKWALNDMQIEQDKSVFSLKDEEILSKRFLITSNDELNLKINFLDLGGILLFNGLHEFEMLRNNAVAILDQNFNFDEFDKKIYSAQSINQLIELTKILVAQIEEMLPTISSYNHFLEEIKKIDLLRRYYNIKRYRLQKANHDHFSDCPVLSEPPLKSFHDELRHYRSLLVDSLSLSENDEAILSINNALKSINSAFDAKKSLEDKQKKVSQIKEIDNKMIKDLTERIISISDLLLFLDIENIDNQLKNYEKLITISTTDEQKKIVSDEVNRFKITPFYSTQNPWFLILQTTRQKEELELLNNKLVKYQKKYSLGHLVEIIEKANESIIQIDKFKHELENFYDREYSISNWANNHDLKIKKNKSTSKKNEKIFETLYQKTRISSLQCFIKIAKALFNHELSISGFPLLRHYQTLANRLADTFPHPSLEKTLLLLEQAESETHLKEFSDQWLKIPSQTRDLIKTSEQFNESAKKLSRIYFGLTEALKAYHNNEPIFDITTNLVYETLLQYRDIIDAKDELSANPNFKSIYKIQNFINHHHLYEISKIIADKNEFISYRRQNNHEYIDDIHKLISEPLPDDIIHIKTKEYEIRLLMNEISLNNPETVMLSQYEKLNDRILFINKAILKLKDSIEEFSCKIKLINEIPSCDLSQHIKKSILSAISLRIEEAETIYKRIFTLYEALIDKKNLITSLIENIDPVFLDNEKKIFEATLFIIKNEGGQFRFSISDLPQKSTNSLNSSLIYLITLNSSYLNIVTQQNTLRELILQANGEKEKINQLIISESKKDYLISCLNRLQKKWQLISNNFSPIINKIEQDISSVKEVINNLKKLQFNHYSSVIKYLSVCNNQWNTIIDDINLLNKNLIKPSAILKQHDINIIKNKLIYLQNELSTNFKELNSLFIEASETVLLFDKAQLPVDNELMLLNAMNEQLQKISLRLNISSNITDEFEKSLPTIGKNHFININKLISKAIHYVEYLYHSLDLAFADSLKWKNLINDAKTLLEATQIIKSSGYFSDDSFEKVSLNKLIMISKGNLIDLIKPTEPSELLIFNTINEIINSNPETKYLDELIASKVNQHWLINNKNKLSQFSTLNAIIVALRAKQIISLNQNEFLTTQINESAPEFSISDKISLFIQQDILSHASIDIRTIAMERWIWTAYFCYQNGDFNGLSTILMTLSSPQIDVLNASYKGLTDKAKAIFDELVYYTPINSDLSIEKLRTIIEEISSISIPYLDLYTNINFDISKKSLVQFSKLQHKFVSTNNDMKFSLFQNNIININCSPKSINSFYNNAFKFEPENKNIDPSDFLISIQNEFVDPFVVSNQTFQLKSSPIDKLDSDKLVEYIIQNKLHFNPSVTDSELEATNQAINKKSNIFTLSRLLKQIGFNLSYKQLREIRK